MRPAGMPEYGARARKKKPPKLTLAAVPKQNGYRVLTGDDGLDEVLGKPGDPGLYVPSVVMFAGTAGSGKSSLLLRMGFRSVERSILYVSTEEDLSEIRDRAEAFGYGEELGQLPVLASEELGEVMEKIREYDPRIVILDSLNDLIDSRPPAEGGDKPGDDMGNLTRHTYTLVDEARANNRALVIVSHMNKRDDMTGTKRIQHRVHVVMKLDRVPGTKLRMLHCPHKNRKGPTGVEVYYKMTSQGLVRTDPPSKDEPEKKERGPRVRDVVDQMTRNDT